MVKLRCWEKNKGELQVNLQGNEREKEEDEVRGILVLTHLSDEFRGILVHSRRYYAN